jgi:prepilin peptidase CpaA
LNYVDALTILMVGIAALIDLKSRKIPNWLTLTMAAAGILGGFLLYAWHGEWSGGWNWLLFSSKGWLVGIGIFLLPFIFGGMGGGDVKLMGAIGAFKGTEFVIATAILGALWGGLMSIGAIIVKKKPGMLKNFGAGLKLYFITHGQVGKDLIMPAEDVDQENRVYIPYGIAIFLGLITTYIIKPFN